MPFPGQRAHADAEEHVPRHREAPSAVLQAIVEFANRSWATRPYDDRWPFAGVEN